MEVGGSRVLGKTAYGFLFVVVVPAALWFWSRRMDSLVSLPTPHPASVGIAIAAFGAAIMFLGMAALYRYGGGLPMSPFPPPRMVTQGIYRTIAHPIYLGFTIFCVGAAIMAKSPGGLWLVTPTVGLCCVALVLGFERENLRSRFGGASPGFLLRLPADVDTPCRFADRASTYVLVLLPWLVLYEAVQLLGIPKGAFETSFPFERRWPVIEWTEALYASVYVLTLISPLIARTCRDLRRFSILGLIGGGIAIFCFLVFPTISTPRPFTPNSELGRLLVLERRYDSSAGAFPACHVIWALVTCGILVARFPRWKVLWYAWAAAASVSCITTGMHSMADVGGGIAAYIITARHIRIRDLTRSWTERIANSWGEWRIGPVRIINHGLYAGAGTAIGILIIGILLGPSHVAAILITGLFGLVGAGLWAQMIEGSSGLLRPFGYYGSVLGIMLGAGIAHWTGTSIWLMLAAFAVAGPWIQAAGRLRCLVQGCCHGRPGPETIGIRYTHPRSRVARLAHLTGIPLHPTPLYSIAWNIALGVITARLWQIRPSLPILPGIYLILSGIGRFLEESYRGEPQTPTIAGLRLYQWMATGSVAVGAFMTAVKTSVPWPSPQLSAEAAAAASLLGLMTWFALGVDFPSSNRRFSRLT